MTVFCKSKKSFFSPLLNQHLLKLHLRPAPRPPPFITLPLFCAPLIWLVVALPSASTPISSQLCLVPLPPPLVVPLLVTAFGIVCNSPNSPLPCVAPLSFGWLSHIPAHQPLASCSSHLVGCRISQRLTLSLSLHITVSVDVMECVRRQRGDSFAVAFAHPPPGCGPKEGRVRVDNAPVPGITLELGQKASCVSQL